MREKLSESLSDLWPHPLAWCYIEGARQMIRLGAVTLQSKSPKCQLWRQLMVSLTLCRLRSAINQFPPQDFMALNYLDLLQCELWISTFMVLQWGRLQESCFILVLWWFVVNFNNAESQYEPCKNIKGSDTFMCWDQLWHTDVQVFSSCVLF